MIVLLGTSHVSKQSAAEVREAIGSADVVCLELDRARLQGILTEQQATFSELRKALGLRTAVVASTLRWIQKRVAKSLNVLPGVEMRAAFDEAAKQQKLVALIDRDVKITMQRLSKSIGWRELFQMIKDLKPRKMPIHPSDEIVLQLIGELKEKYPRIYAAVVAERDVHMSKVLVKVQQEHPEKTILAVVGKGHVPGMLEHINYLNSALDVHAWSSPVKRLPQSSRSA